MKLNSLQLSVLLTDGMEVMASRDSSPRLMMPKEMYISTLHTSSSFQAFSTLAWTCRHRGRRGQPGTPLSGSNTLACWNMYSPQSILEHKTFLHHH